MSAPYAPAHAEAYDVDDEEEGGTNVWEQPMERSWDIIEEDEKGKLKSRHLEEQRARKHKMQEQLTDMRLVEKGMIRYLFIILDFSDAMKYSDFRPSRRNVMIEQVNAFVREFFDQNPISQLGFIVTYNQVAKKLTELSGNPKQQLQQLHEFHEGGGIISLQNALSVALDSLKQIPLYGSREVVIVMGSLGTCDPGDIFQTISELKQHRIRASVISMSAEMYVCRKLTETTLGDFAVATKSSHLRELLFKHVVPLPTPASQRAASRKWIRMGFPQKQSDPYPSLCACHKRFSYTGYLCPKCKTKLCELPSECNVCGLTLVSSPHLARSYHHLFPVARYDEVSLETLDRTTLYDCKGCEIRFSPFEALAVKCPHCKSIFCADCDVFIHESLHNCPGCQSVAASSAPGGS